MQLFGFCCLPTAAGVTLQKSPSDTSTLCFLINKNIIINFYFLRSFRFIHILNDKMLLFFALSADAGIIFLQHKIKLSYA